MALESILQNSHEISREAPVCYRSTHCEFSILQRRPFLAVLPIILGYLGSSAHREISETFQCINARKIKFIAKPLPIQRCSDLDELLIDREVLKVIYVMTALPPRVLPYIFSYFSPDEMRLVCHPSLRILNLNYSFMRESLSSIKKEIEDDASGNKVVCDVMQIENYYPDHTFFYHGMRLSNFLSTFFIDALFANIIHEKRNFIPLMPLPSAAEPQTIQEFLALHPPDDDAVYDTSPEVRRSLLSVNLSLFSNANNGWESTWKFYRQNSNMNIKGIRENLEGIFNKYKLVSDPIRKSDCLAQLEKQYKRLEKCAITYQTLLASNIDGRKSLFKGLPSGVVLQLAVPDELVDKVAYSCEDFGLPCDISKSGGFSNLVQELSHHERLARLSKNARVSRDDGVYRFNTQARLLVPALQVPDHNIQAFVHGYGRFFDSRLKEISPLFKNGEILPWGFSDNLRRAQKVDTMENSQACLKLVKQKEEIILKIQAIFAEMLLENGCVE